MDCVTLSFSVFVSIGLVRICRSIFTEEKEVPVTETAPPKRVYQHPIVFPTVNPMAGVEMPSAPPKEERREVEPGPQQSVDQEASSDFSVGLAEFAEEVQKDLLLEADGALYISKVMSNLRSKRKLVLKRVDKKKRELATLFEKLKSETDKEAKASLYESASSCKEELKGSKRDAVFIKAKMDFLSSIKHW